MDNVLDNPVLSSLLGTHRGLAITAGRVARYPVEVSPFMGLPGDADEADWEQLIALAGDDAIVLVNGPERWPVGIEEVRRFAVLQMVASGELTVRAAADDVVIERLSGADAAEMLDLAQRTEPGPFGVRTGELGAYYGVRDGEKLVAMAGERMRPAGWTEISGVCTDPAYRGRGLAGVLMERVFRGASERGDRSFLHVFEGNAGAIRLYEAMGFTVRRSVVVSSYRKVGQAGSEGVADAVDRVLADG
ncbi:GNAT family N-acetyltransferase [Kribbella koreensis]|uniref:GNAT family N-acetyltransferase n=1 Tax=Kribbella koreensis TaxID=57909 RepID=A0ABP4BTH6_9ACTN